MNCNHCEERMSDYLENALSAGERHSMELHLQSCLACSELLAGMAEVLAWGKNFSIYEPPAWLAQRIIANTPPLGRETWLDTLASIGRWLIEPRHPMGVFTLMLVFGLLGGLPGISAHS